ncbi:hypothetical protein D3C81_789040 [compost metagenome]
MAKAKPAPKTEQAETQAAVADSFVAAEDRSASDQTTAHSLYGDVAPTMVNGQYVGTAPASKPAPTLRERIAMAFNSERQIEAVLSVLEVAGGGTGEVSDATSSRAVDFETATAATDARLTDLSTQLDQALDRVADLEARLSALAGVDERIAQIEAGVARALELTPAAASPSGD